MARRYRQWLERGKWSDAAIARRLTREGQPTSRAAANAWRHGRSRPDLERLVLLKRISDGELDAEAFTETDDNTDEARS